MPPIPGEWIATAGPVGLLSLGVLLVFLGWLVPLRTYRALERDRDYWRQAALKSMGHTEALMPAAEIATEVTRAFSEATSKKGTTEKGPT